MENDNRLECYKKLIEAYNCFNTMQYNNAASILKNILKDIEELYKQSPYFDYYRRRMEYNRLIPKNSKSMQKRFVEWFHKAMFNISKNHYIDSYSYIRDMKTILEKLKNNIIEFDNGRIAFRMNIETGYMEELNDNNRTS